MSTGIRPQPTHPARAKPPDPALRARIRIRDARPDDAAAIVSLVNAAYRPRDWWLFGVLRTSEDEYRASTTKPGAASIVAELHADAAGHVALWLEPDGAWLGMLATAPSMQGRGIATLLMDEAERRARDAGYREMRLDCVRENGLVEYYESLAYTIEHEERGRVRPHAAAGDATRDWTRVYMRKPL